MYGFLSASWVLITYIICPPVIVGWSSPFMRLAEQLTFRVALGASDVCLVDENQTCSVPALKGCVGLWSYDYGRAW